MKRLERLSNVHQFTKQDQIQNYDRTYLLIGVVYSLKKKGNGKTLFHHSFTFSDSLTTFRIHTNTLIW